MFWWSLCQSQSHNIQSIRRVPVWGAASHWSTNHGCPEWSLTQTELPKQLVIYFRLPCVPREFCHVSELFPISPSREMPVFVFKRQVTGTEDGQSPK